MNHSKCFIKFIYRIYLFIYLFWVVVIFSQLDHGFLNYGSLPKTESLGFITRNSYEYRNVQCFIHLYKSLFRPFVEDATEVWSPFSIRKNFSNLSKINFFVNYPLGYLSQMIPLCMSQCNLISTFLTSIADYFDVAFIYKLLNN